MGGGVVSPEEIDKINILNASFLAMHRAVDQLNVRPQHLLIDGNRFKKYRDLPHTTVVKGVREVPFPSLPPPFWQRPIVMTT